MTSLQGTIALVTPQLAPGGAERYVVNLARRLTLAGESVCVISSGGAMASELDVPHVRAPIHRRGPLSVIRSAMAINRVRPALVHANSLNAAIAAQWVRRWRRTPVLLTGHGWPGRDMRHVARIAAATCDRVIAVSDYVEGELSRAGFPPDRLEVVRHGVDTQLFRPPPDRQKLRHRLELTGDTVVLYAGRLEREKGLDVLLAAWEVVATKAPSAMLLVAGDGSLRHLLERPRSGIRYLGQRSDVAELLGAADLLVLPSRYEALGMVALEALACGVPVVATGVGGITEVVDDEVGRIVPTEQPAAMAAAILQLARSTDAGALRKNAAERAQREYSLERMVERTREVYDSIRRERALH